MNFLDSMDRPVLAIGPVPSPIRRRRVPVRVIEVDAQPVPIYRLPIPARRFTRSTSKWREILASLKPGECFEVENRAEQSHVLTVAKTMGVPITTRIMESGGIFVWRKDT